MHEKCTSLTRSSAKMAAERTLDTMHPWYCTSRLLHEANSYHLLIARQVLADHHELQGAIRIDPMIRIYVVGTQVRPTMASHDILADSFT